MPAPTPGDQTYVATQQFLRRVWNWGQSYGLPLTQAAVATCLILLGWSQLVRPWLYRKVVLYTG